MDMKIEIGQTTYTDIYDIKFAPEVDLLSETIPINSFEAKIKTRDNISLGSKASLKDGNFLLAYYDITSIKWIDDDVVQVKAEDVLAKLDRVRLPAYYYDNLSFDIVGIDFATQVNRESYEEITINLAIPSSQTYPTITGYCPEQTARERLQMLCNVAGYYVTTAYSTYDGILLEVPSIFDDPTYIPDVNIAWIPQNSDREFATEIQLNSFELTRIAPALIQAVDDYVMVEYPSEQYFLYLTFPERWKNPYAAGATPNPIEIDDNMLINNSNFNTVLARYATYYARGGLEMSVEMLNNPTLHLIGSIVSFPTGVGRQIAIGYITSQELIFGETLKIKAKIRIIDYTQGYYLTIDHVLDLGDDFIFKTDKYLLPDGYNYSLPLKSEQAVNDNRIYICNPEQSTATGTITSEDEERFIYYDYGMRIDNGVAYIKGVKTAVKSTTNLIIGGNQSYDKPDDEIENVYYIVDRLSLDIKNDKMNVIAVENVSQTTDELRL